MKAYCLILNLNLCTQVTSAGRRDAGKETINRNMAVAIEQGQKGHDGSYARRHSITTLKQINDQFLCGKLASIILALLHHTINPFRGQQVKLRT